MRQEVIYKMNERYIPRIKGCFPKSNLNLNIKVKYESQVEIYFVDSSITMPTIKRSLKYRKLLKDMARELVLYFGFNNVTIRTCKIETEQFLYYPERNKVCGIHTGTYPFIYQGRSYYAPKEPDLVETEDELRDLSVLTI